MMRINRLYLAFMSAALLLAFLASGSSSAQEMTVRNVVVGFNGPTKGRAEYFTSASAVRGSWLAKALQPSDLKSLLSAVDFKTQIVVATSIGERATATGTVKIRVAVNGSVMTVVGPESSGPGELMIYASVGVVSGKCAEPRHSSYPFAAGVIKRPVGLQPLVSTDVGNFPDGCRPIKSGQAVE
jgi:hypothetical protein